MSSDRIEIIYVSEIAKTLSGGCKYRLFLNSPPNNQDSEIKMPIYPQTIIGEVYHKIFKEITDGMHTDNDLKLLIINRTEELAADYYNSRDLLNIPNFRSAKYLRKFQNKASGLGERRARNSQFNSSRRKFNGFGREIRVEGFRGQVIGRVDEVRNNNGEIEIIDDKTGDIIKSGNFSEIYENQLLIYALLWGVNWGKKVNSIILRDSGGGITWKKELSNLDLEGINSQIGTILNILQDDSNSVLELACPTHDNCRFCEHRVTCIPHRELKNKLTLNQACFLSGEILKFFPLPGSKMKLTVRINGELYQTIVAKNSISFNSDELPIDAEFHAFYLDSRRPRQLNPRKESYRVIKLQSN